MTKLSRTGRLFTALTVGCAALAVAPTMAAAAPAAMHAPAKHPVKIHAKPAKQRLHVGEKTKIDGRLDVATAARTDDPEILIVQQEIRAGIWIDLTNTTCRPNGSFSLDISFDVAADVSLRVYHPDTELYAEAYSDVFAMVVI